MEEPILKKQLLSVQALIVVISLFFLEACSFQQNSQSPSNNAAHPQKPPSSAAYAAVNWKLPITIPKGEFFKVGGWLSDEQLLYITNKGQTSSLYCYQLNSGKSTLLLKSEFPIVDILISPGKKDILIQAAPSSYEAKITVIDSHGSEKYSQLVPSHELAFEWNPYKQSEVLMSKFEEDWTFQVALINLERKTIQQLSLPQPLLKWINQNEVAYINWDTNNHALFAPLIFRSLIDGKDTSVFPKVFQFSAFKSMIMTITVNEQEKTKAKYTFYDSKLKPIYSFAIPQLTKYSDYLVPFYDYNEKNHQFITFRPLKSTSQDAYKEGFQLALYNLADRKSSVLLKGLDNAPISLSPSGNALLYGNRLEKIIDLRNKKIFKLVKE